MRYKYSSQEEASAAQREQQRLWRLARPHYARDRYQQIYKHRRKGPRPNDYFRYWKSIWRGVAAGIRAQDPAHQKAYKLHFLTGKAKQRALQPQLRPADPNSLTSILRRLVATQNRGCAYCGEDLRGSNFEIDHKVPRTRGGANGEENLQLVCRPCNMMKNAQTHDEFLIRCGRIVKRCVM